MEAGGDNHFYYVIQLEGGCSGPAFFIKREGRGTEQCLGAPQYDGSTLIDKAGC